MLLGMLAFVGFQFFLLLVFEWMGRGLKIGHSRRSDLIQCVVATDVRQLDSF